MRWISPLLLVAGCVACVPLPRQFYIPEGAGGHVTYSPCLPKDVPASIQFLVVERVTLNVRVDAMMDGRHYIEVRFDLYAVDTVNLLDDKVKFSWASKRPNSESTFQKLSRVDAPIVNMQNPAVQKRMFRVQEPMVGGGSFWLATYINPEPDGEFSVTLPSIAVNGAVVALPEVRFRKGPYATIAPINC